MEEVLNKVELNIDKTKWVLVKFGDVVFEPKETCKDIIKEGIEHVVGLEHIETGDIHLRNSAGVEEATTFTKKFRKDDVLFGRRRAYLKKAAQADFDGICSGDITVFRAKKDLLPELLPFLVFNDKFFDYAVKHSAGGLSPRVKFQDLANYEFLLPPKDEQARLAELLWAMDEVIEREFNTMETLNRLRNAQLRDTYLISSKSKVDYKSVKLHEVIVLSSGKSRPEEMSDKQNEKYLFPVYGGNGIIGYSDVFLIEFDTIILGRVGEYCGVVHDTFGKAWISDNALYVKEFLKDIDKFYLSRYLEFIDLNKQQNRSSYPLITQGKVYQNIIPIRTTEKILSLNAKLRKIELLIYESKSRISTSKTLLKSLLKQIF